jgi:hypothetical protein
MKEQNMTDGELKQALKAAENGDTEAMIAVAMAYADLQMAALENGNMQGVVTNANLMLSWMQKAAARGSAEAKEMLTGMFRQWSAAAGQGDAESMLTLSGAYLRGIGTDADYRQAVFWARKAGAARGNAKIKLQAKGTLAFAEAMLPAGNFRELLEGAQKGNANFQYALGFAYLKGFGTEVNPQQAVFWFQKAFDQKHKGALQTLPQVQATLAVGGDNFDQVIPVTAYKGLARFYKKHPVLWGIVVGAVVSYLAKGLDTGWLYSLAIFFNICWITSLPLSIIASVFAILIMASKGRAQAIVTAVFYCLYVLLGIAVIALSVHYIRGRKAGNPVSIVLQNPFEAARERIFGAARASEPEIVEPPAVTATVTSSAANIRSAPDSSKNNVIIQARNGDTLMVTGPAERGWLPVEVDGKPGYVSSELVEINDN